MEAWATLLAQADSTAGRIPWNKHPAQQVFSGLNREAKNIEIDMKQIPELMQKQNVEK